MKTFFLKLLITGVLIVVIYYLTIREPIEKIIKILDLVDSSSEREVIRNKVKYKFLSEIENASSKDKILYEKDRIIIKKFLDKLISELNLELK